MKVFALWASLWLYGVSATDADGSKEPTASERRTAVATSTGNLKAPKERYCFDEDMAKPVQVKESDCPHRCCYHPETEYEKKLRERCGTAEECEEQEIPVGFFIFGFACCCCMCWSVVIIHFVGQRQQRREAKDLAEAKYGSTSLPPPPMGQAPKGQLAVPEAGQKAPKGQAPKAQTAQQLGIVPDSVSAGQVAGVSAAESKPSAQVSGLPLGRFSL